MYLGNGWDDSWGEGSEYADENGLSAFNACCGCGGGKMTNTDFTIEEECEDQASWINGDFETCADYANSNYCNSDGTHGSGWTLSWGHLSEYTDEAGVSGLQACCTCGGGSTSTLCQDQLGWYNGDGESCATYAESAYCKADGTIGSGWDAAWGDLSE